MDASGRSPIAMVVGSVAAALRTVGAATVAAVVAGVGWMALVASETAQGDEAPHLAAGLPAGEGATSGGGVPAGGATEETAVSLGEPTVPLGHTNQRLAEALADEPDVLEPLVAAARRHDVDPRLVLAVAWHESRWDPAARSHAGAVGAMQVKPQTVRRVAREIDEPLTPTDPADNATAGVVYLSWLKDRFETTRRALIAYNQGSGALRREGPYPPAERYAEAVLDTRRHLERAGWRPSTASR